MPSDVFAGVFVRAVCEVAAGFPVKVGDWPFFCDTACNRLFVRVTRTISDNLLVQTGTKWLILGNITTDRAQTSGDWCPLISHLCPPAPVFVPGILHVMLPALLPVMSRPCAWRRPARFF